MCRSIYSLSKNDLFEINTTTKTSVQFNIDYRYATMGK